MNKKIDSGVGSKARAATGKAAVAELSPQALSRNKDLHPTGGVGGQNRALNDVKDLGVVGGKKRGSNPDAMDSQSAININS